MELRLQVRNRSASLIPVLVTCEPSTPVGAVAATLARSHPGLDAPDGAVTLAVGHGKVLHQVPPVTWVSEAGIQSGQTVSVVPSTDVAAGSEVAATARVISGPDEGTEFPLPAGSSFIGRDESCRVRLTDPMVSQVHARLFIEADARIFDQSSSNGVEVGGVLVSQSVIRPDEVVRVGLTLLQVALAPQSRSEPRVSSTVSFTRPPRLDPRYRGTAFTPPEVPPTPPTARIPFIPLIMPILLGAVLYLVTRSIASLVFVAISPLLMAGMAIENRFVGKKAFVRQSEQFRKDLVSLADEVALGKVAEREARAHEHPALADFYAAAAARSDLLWCRHPSQPGFLQLRLGLGTQASRSTIAIPSGRSGDPALAAELDALVDAASQVDGVPVVLDLGACGSVGIAGPWQESNSAARAVVLQAVLAHAPAELMVAALLPPTAKEYWDWLLWLPHAEAAERVLGTNPLTVGGGPGVTLATAIERVIRERQETEVDLDGDDPAPRLLVIVGHDAPVPMPTLVSIATQGPGVGVHVIWVAARRRDLPAACQAYLTRSPTGATFGDIATGESLPITVEEVGIEEATSAALHLAPVIDDAQSDEQLHGLPASVSFLDIAGIGLADTPDDVIDRWRESGSLEQAVDDPGRKRTKVNLRGLVGVTSSGPLQLDLRTQGPHALVGGTTGSGKSEFLQSWVLGMAAAHSPRQVTFLLVDYKGGSAFSDCVRLPHTVGLVTDLSASMVRRALISLNAELRYREHVLNRGGYKDIAEMEKAGDPSTPPSLVIVVDEFAALVQEVPQFVDGVVNVAQRGRSLGLHLVLATQRPAGVIKDNLRANTNLRIALRVADEADSQDIVGDPCAGSFDPSIPGRAVFAAGSSRLTTFQSAYVGGFTSRVTSSPAILVSPLQFAPGEDWPIPEAPTVAVPVDGDGRKDVQRLVDTIGAAHVQAALPEPRKPWLPSLGEVYDLHALAEGARGNAVVFGVRDDPEAQDQSPVAFHPDRDGSMVVFGASGAGKSGFLRALAVSAGLPGVGGPCIVYGLDFGSRGLAPLEVLPHVGSIVAGDDGERIARLIWTVRAMISERAQRYGAAHAGTIAEYRLVANRPDEPRVLILIDGMDAFRHAYELGHQAKLFDQAMSLAAEGRPVGVHVVVSADRPGAVPVALASSLQARLVLRMASETDLLMLGVPKDMLLADTPPGRGVMGGLEVQVAVLGDDPSAPGQAAALALLAESLRATGVPEAPEIMRLPDEVALVDLPAEADGLPVLGLADDTLAPTGFPDAGVFLVCGPPRSGRTTTLRSIVASLRRARPQAALAFFGSRASSLLSSVDWDFAAGTEDEAAELAGTLLEKAIAEPIEPTSLVVVIEGISDFLSSPADLPLQRLIKACRTHDQLVIAEGETSSLSGSWPLLQAVKGPRCGMALQPDLLDGDSVFRTSFPRVTRAEFPEGRGLRVVGGRVTRVQVAVP
ncbi:MAG: FtsK/SpoIIIE domain-containing protein [Actinomycetota bacterium]|nr:FtsK/SpoIIIE domain-containing protein [Actinomycetota bacterium]